MHGQTLAGPERAAHAPRAVGRLRRWCRRGLVVAFLVVCLYLFRVPLLVLLARGLVVDDPVQPEDAVLILPGDTRPLETDGRVFEAVARLHRRGLARTVLVLESPKTRLVRCGALPSLGTLAAKELAARGVPADAIRVIGTGDRTDWERARTFRGWLQTQPQSRVAVLCDRFATRRRRLVFSTILREESSSLRWHGLADRRFDETNWWQDRVGVATLFGSYVRLGHCWWCGENREESREWDRAESAWRLGGQ